LAGASAAHDVIYGSSARSRSNIRDAISECQGGVSSLINSGVGALLTDEALGDRPVSTRWNLAHKDSMRAPKPGDAQQMPLTSRRSFDVGGSSIFERSAAFQQISPHTATSPRLDAPIPTNRTQSGGG
jgi:hypothetical protein